MKKIVLFTALLFLTGCFGGPTFDASSEQAMEASLEEMGQELSQEERSRLGKAVMYFAIGGKDGLKNMMANAFSGNTIDPEQMMGDNMAQLDGLTAEEIMEKHREAVASGK